MARETSVRRVRLSTGPVLAYVEVGPPTATPVLLLHAWGETGSCFDRLLRLLPDTVHAIAIDQRGHGYSEVPQAGYSLTELADDVIALVDALDLPPAVLLGSSSGGYLAQQVAVCRPDLVAGLVLVGAPRTLQGRPPFADEVDRLTDPVDASWVRRSLTWFPRTHDVPEWYLEDRVRDGTGIPAHVWRQTLDGLCAANPPTEAGTVVAPTLVIWGDRDELLTRDHQEGLARAIPRSELVVFEGTGHLVLWEQPERVAHDLATFVANLPARSW